LHVRAITRCIRCAIAEQSAKEELEAIEDCVVRSDFELTAISAVNYEQWIEVALRYEVSNQHVIVHPRAKNPFHIGTLGIHFGRTCACDRRQIWCR